MSPNMQIVIGYLIAAFCFIGTIYGGYIAKSGHDRKREQSATAQHKDNQIVKVNINRIIEDANPWLEAKIEEDKTETDKIKANFNMRGMLHSGGHIVTHINRVNSFINLVNDYIKEINRKIEDLLLNSTSEKFENASWLKDEYKKYLDFIKAAEVAKNQKKQESNILCIGFLDGPTFNAILSENPYKE